MCSIKNTKLFLKQGAKKTETNKRKGYISMFKVNKNLLVEQIPIMFALFNQLMEFFPELSCSVFTDIFVKIVSAMCKCFFRQVTNDYY